MYTAQTFADIRQNNSCATIGSYRNSLFEPDVDDIRFSGIHISSYQCSSNEFLMYLEDIYRYRACRSLWNIKQNNLLLLSIYLWAIVGTSCDQAWLWIRYAAVCACECSSFCEFLHALSSDAHDNVHSLFLFGVVVVVIQRQCANELM